MGNIKQLPTDTNFVVFDATMKHLEANPKVQTELCDKFFTMRLRRLIHKKVDEMLTEVTDLASVHTEKFGYENRA